MLTRFHKILIGLLAVQLVLAVVMLTRGDDAAARKAQPLLAGFDAAKVTKLEVTGREGKSLALAKQGAGWVVASAFDYPVKDRKVDDLLAAIAKAAADSPIATQQSRHKQLRVDDGELERKLVLTIDGKPTTLYLGTAAGSRRTAVRLGGDARVYAVGGLDTWSIGSEPREWIDTKYFQITKDEVQKLTVDHDGSSIELERDGEHWKAAIDGKPIALAPGETLDTDHVDRVLEALSDIELSSPADPKRDASKPTATITIARKAASAATPASGAVIVDVIADGSSWWVHDRASPRAALVDKGRLEVVTGLTRDKLVKKPEPPAKPKAAL